MANLNLKAGIAPGLALLIGLVSALIAGAFLPAGLPTWLPWAIGGLMLPLAYFTLRHFLERSSMDEDAGSSEVAHDILPRPSEWSREMLRQMDWKRYEEVCAAYYDEAGIRNKALFLGQVGGIDVRLYQDEPDKPSAIVRCKASSVHRLDGQPVLELVGAMARQRVPKSFYMTREGFRDEAVELAAAHGVTLVDSSLFLSLVQHLPRKGRKHLLEFATGGDWSTPTCPACGIKMQKRAKGDMLYWRCPNAVRCGKRLKIRKETATGSDLEPQHGQHG